MSAVEKVQSLMVGESHVRHDESKQWCVKYRTALQEMAIELDALQSKLNEYQYASLERKWTETPALLKAQKQTKSEATSIRMKAYWAAKKAKK